MAKYNVIEITIPIHAWLIKRAVNEPSLRMRLEQELGSEAFKIAKAAVKS